MRVLGTGMLPHGEQLSQARGSQKHVHQGSGSLGAFSKDSLAPSFHWLLLGHGSLRSNKCEQAAAVLLASLRLPAMSI